MWNYFEESSRMIPNGIIVAERLRRWSDEDGDKDFIDVAVSVNGEKKEAYLLDPETANGVIEDLCAIGEVPDFATVDDIIAPFPWRGLFVKEDSE
jgi:hypothetical protein